MPASLAFDIDVELCPPYWPWPFPHRVLGPTEGPHPEPWDQIPAGGQISLRMFRALTIYNMAAQYHDAQERRDLQALAVRQLGALTSQLQELSKQEKG